MIYTIIAFAVCLILSCVAGFILGLREGQSMDIKIMEKPLLGLTPKRIVELQRANDIMEAVHRYFSRNKPIPIEWIQEYNDIVGK
jgi:hypothetical protein